MVSHKTLGHPAMIFGLAVVSFIIGLKGTMLVDDAKHAERAVAVEPSGHPVPSEEYRTTSSPSEGLSYGPVMPTSVFVGTWNERWSNVSSEIRIHDNTVDGAPEVSKPGDWRVWGEHYENGVLSFRLRGGDSDWEFVYWVVYNPSNPDHLQLRVNRVFDNSFYDGEMVRTGGIPPPASGTIEEAPVGGQVGGVPGGVPGGLPGEVTGGQFEEEAPKRIRMSSQVLLGKIVDRVFPTYPPIARQARIQGVVMLEVVVDVDGLVSSTRVVSGHPMLTQAAIEAVRQWSFEPTYVNGEPVEVTSTIPVNFKLSDSSAPEGAVAPAETAPTPSTSSAGALAPFLGRWSERWSNVEDTDSLVIAATPGGAPDVRATSSSWRVWDEKFDGRRLSFRLRGGPSDWEFIYTAEYDSPGRLRLRVHRVHDNQDFTGELYQSGRGASAAAPAPTPAPSAPPAAVPAPSGLQAFTGTWTSHWADVTDTRGFTISIENGRPKVSRSGNWRAWDESFDGRVLSFRTAGGDSNWSFVYYLEYAGPNRLKLRVHRDHDSQEFTGEFTR